MIIINPIPGQEEQNANFLEKSHVGVWLRREDNIKEVLEAVLKNDKRLEVMKQNAIRLARKTSTQDICEKIMG